MTQRYVIHLPIVANDLSAAQRLARVVGRWLLILPPTTTAPAPGGCDGDQVGEHGTPHPRTRRTLGP
ncbi:hypothetical protein [Micromonospora chersina]|uniref:hypothetical protein n=1 Tax=Micromonospora chersina TaxID=47854 RepID=UPI0037109EBB